MNVRHLMKGFFLIAIFSMAFIPGMIFAGEQEEPVIMAALDEESDMGEMAELLAILEEETEVATKTKMNADYVPGIVTVLHGEDLEAMGARTVWEAIGFVPGVETRIDNHGRPMVVIRGISGKKFTGHLNLMVNSVSIVSSFRGTNDPIMMVPIEQVERIEVIRGTGSALYGEFAYSGVVNIITRKEGKRLYGSAAKYGTYGAGGLYSHSNEEKELKVSINAAGWKTDGADVNSGIDGVEARLGQTGISFSPGPTNEDEKLRSLALNLDYKKTGLSFYRVERKYGHYFGMDTLNPDSDGTPNDDEYWHINARQQLEITPTFNGSLNVNLSENEATGEGLLLPPGAAPPPPPPPPGPPPPGPAPLPPSFPDGHAKITYVKERRIEGGLDLNWTGWEKHTWLLRLSAAKVKIRDAWEASNFNSITLTNYATIQRLPHDEDMWIDAGKERKIMSAVLQDQFEVSEDFTLTIAVRYDDFDDVGNEVTGRAAGVWKIGEPHLIKFQYAEAYRPPNLAQLYLPPTGPGAHGNPDLKPESSKYYEAGYIYRRPGIVGRATLFYTRMEDMITEIPGPGHQPENSDEIKLKGAEVEIEKKLGERFKTTANLSYLDAEDKTNDQDVANSTDLIGNLTLEARITDNLLAAVSYRHLDERKRSKTDTRDDLDGYDTVDLAVSHFNLGAKGLTVRAGVKNIFDEDIKAPNENYQDDLPRPGRTWWTQVSREF